MAGRRKEERMGKYILMVLGILSALYGILVLQVGSGTIFWLLWEAIAVFFFFWGALVYKKFFTLHKKCIPVFGTLVGMGAIVLMICCSLIGGTFFASGQPKLDYIIVLGAQVREDGPSVVLKYRLDTAVDYLNANPDTLCIVSGGKGANEPFSEAEGMANYLTEKGIAAERILLEDQSVNTAENIRYSKKLMEESYDTVGIVTNNFHVFRAVKIAEKQGMESVCGIAARSNTLYLANNVLRECCGILKDWIMDNI